MVIVSDRSTTLEMVDRLTQLQEAVNQLGEFFCNSIGVLQQPEPEQPQQGDSKEPASQEENAALFASLISRTAQDIDILIDSLPSQESTPEKQVENLRALQVENQQAALRLAAAVEEGEALLASVRIALKEMCDSQLLVGRSEHPSR